MKWFFGFVLSVGSIMGVAVHSSPAWSQGWLIDIPVGWLIVAAVFCMVMAISEM